MNPALVDAAVLGAVLLPLSVAIALTLGAWSKGQLAEHVVTGAVGGAFGVSLCLTLIAALGVASNAGESRVVSAGTWFAIHDYRFGVSFVADRLSMPFAGFAAALTGLIAAFSRRYLHREAGFTRFFTLLTWFGSGALWVAYAASLDVLFLGWEVVGITSALLIAFFDHRQGPVTNGMRAFGVYRVCDIFFLAAIVWLHHGHGSSQLTPGPSWYGLPAQSQTTTAVALLLVVASIGKAAQVPLGGWLPRAMEGPTPSSAVFYGALSVHLGPLLMLRASPLLAESPQASWLLLAVGVASALHGTFVGRVQTDIKSVLAYASMTQVGVIMAEIALGLHYLALLHILGHAALRTLQILRASSILHDYHHLERAMGSHVPRTGLHIERLIPRGLQPWLYRHALERGYFDSLLADYVLQPLGAAMGWLERMDQRWLDWLGGATDRTLREPEPSAHRPASVRPARVRGQR